MRETLNRLLDWFRRDALAREADEELAFHRGLLARDHRAAGASDADAQQAATRRLGNLTRLREGLRDMWRIDWIDELASDLRYTIRGLRRQPGFTMGVVVTLALGLGANAAMFGVIDRLMFRPYPLMRDPGTVHRVYLESLNRGKLHIDDGFEYTRYLDLRKWTTSFSQVAAFSSRTLAVGAGEAARELPTATVSASFFDFFDAKPAAGRFFAAAEDTTPRGADVVVLSYGFWMSEFGGRDVLGTTLTVGNELCTIVGVAPKGFAGVDDDQTPDVYIPITAYAGSRPDVEDRTTYYTKYNWGWMSMMVRRKPGVTVEQASADLSNAYARSWDAERLDEPRLTSGAIAKPHAVASGMRPGGGPDPGLGPRTALWVTGVAAIVFLIACANVANLLLGRAFRRRREIAVRLALGVSRRRLLTQCMTESMVLAFLGGGVGLLVAQWGGAAIRGLYLHDAASASLLSDWRTLMVGFGLAVVAGILAGLAPALLSGRGNLAGTLKAGAREGTYDRSRTRSMLLVFQGALSVVLLVGAGVFVRSLNAVRSMRIGYDADPVLMAVAHMRSTTVSDTADVQLGERLLTAATAIPGVEHAAWASSAPFYRTSSVGLYINGIDSVGHLGRFTYQATTPDYFATLGTRILRGRALAAEDRAGAPLVAVVSEAMAGALWPGRDAIGQCMRVDADTMPCTTIVGIAENAAQNSLTDDGKFRYYLPIEQRPSSGGFVLFLKMRADPASQGEAVRKALQPLMPGDTYLTTMPFASVVDEQRQSWRTGATMFVAFGVLALLVAAVGLYSVIAYNVAQRAHELGVRVALGAQANDVIRLIVGQGLRFALAGVVIGAGLAAVAGKWVQPLLFHESARDPLVFAMVAGVLVLAALLASVSPAMRASRADPNLALRGD